MSDVAACERMQCCSGGGPSGAEYRARLRHPRGTCPHPAGSRWLGLDDAAARSAACAACEYAVLATLPGGAGEWIMAAPVGAPPSDMGAASTAASATPTGPAGTLIARLLARMATCRGCDEYDDSLGPALGECAELADGELRRRWADRRAQCPHGYWRPIEPPSPSAGGAAARTGDEQVRA